MEFSVSGNPARDIITGRSIAMSFTFYESDCLDVDGVMTGLTDSWRIPIYGFSNFKNSLLLAASVEDLFALTKSDRFSISGFSVFRSSEIKRLRMSRRG